MKSWCRRKRATRASWRKLPADAHEVHAIRLTMEALLGVQEALEDLSDAMMGFDVAYRS